MAKNRYDVDENLETPFNIEYLKRAMVYVKKHQNKMLVAFGVSILGAFIGLSGPVVTSHIIDVVVPQKNMGALIFWAALLLATIIINLIFITIRGIIMARVGQAIVYDIRSDLF